MVTFNIYRIYDTFNEAAEFADAAALVLGEDIEVYEDFMAGDAVYLPRRVGDPPRMMPRTRLAYTAVAN